MATELAERPVRDGGATDPPPPGRHARWRSAAAALLLPVLVTAVAGALRLYRLGEPERCYFDETYYYYDARDYLERGVERGFAVHPPVGKWMIAVGLATNGVEQGSAVDRAVETDPGRCTVKEDEEPNPALRAREAAESFARRISAAVVGTASVLLTYLIGLRLFRRRGIAALAALLLAVDGLALTMSRIAMLDVFLGFWILAGVLCLLIDRDRQWVGAPPAGHRPSPDTDPTLIDTLPGEADGDGDRDDGHGTPRTGRRRRRPVPQRTHSFRWLAGLCFGLALATKWSALLAIGAAGLFLLVSELTWRRRVTGRALAGFPQLAANVFLTMVAVPALVYVASYASWFANFENTRKADACTEQTCDGVLATADTILRSWWEEQAEIYRFHRDLEAEHPYRAAAWTWALLGRPVAYYYESCTDEQIADGKACAVQEGNVAEVLGIGNPALWWMVLAGYPFLLYLALRRRDWVAWTILGFILLQYLPYWFSPRAVFLFYMTPAVPFMALGLAYLAQRALSVRGLRWLPAAIAILAVAAFVFWFPLYVGLEIPRAAWDARIWIRPGWI